MVTISIMMIEQMCRPELPKKKNRSARLDDGNRSGLTILSWDAGWVGEAGGMPADRVDESSQKQAFHTGRFIGLGRAFCAAGG
jgi:hypothetical protein